MQNGFVESFNGRMRDECLNEHLFDNLSYAGKWVTVFEKAAYRGGCPSLPELPEGTIRL